MDARDETQQLQHRISTIKASEANADDELRELEKNYYEKTAQLEDELVRLAVEKAVGDYLEIALIEVHVNQLHAFRKLTNVFKSCEALEATSTRLCNRKPLTPPVVPSFLVQVRPYPWPPTLRRIQESPRSILMQI